MRIHADPEPNPGYKNIYQTSNLWGTKYGNNHKTLYPKGFAHFTISRGKHAQCAQENNNTIVLPNDRKVFVLMLCNLKLEKEE
jgi:hypothetical protein